MSESIQIADKVESTPAIPILSDKAVAASHKLPYKDQLIIDILREDPTLTNLGIQKKLNELNESKGNSYVYKRLAASELLVRELDEVRSYAQAFVDRELVPRALDIHKKVLTDSNIEPLKKKDWVFKAEDLAFKLDESKRARAPSSINIKQLQVMINDKVKGE